MRLHAFAADKLIRGCSVHWGWHTKGGKSPGSNLLILLGLQAFCQPVLDDVKGWNNQIFTTSMSAEAADERLSTSWGAPLGEAQLAHVSQHIKQSGRIAKAQLDWQSLAGCNGPMWLQRAGLKAVAYTNKSEQDYWSCSGCCC